MAPVGQLHPVPSISPILSQPALVALSLFVVVCILFLLAFTYTLLRRKDSTVQIIQDTKGDADTATWHPLFRRYSYETFECSATPSVLLDEQFIQPQAQNSGCRSNALSPIQENHTEGLAVPAVPLRRHSAPKSMAIGPPLSNCVKVSNPPPTLNLSINFVHTVELLRVVIDKLTGFPVDAAMVYALRLRVMPRSRTSAYLSRPLVTPAVQGSLEFDHLFEYAVSLQRLERAKVEVTLFARPCSADDAFGRRRHTVGAIAYTRRGSAAGKEVKLTELLTDYRQLGKAELTLDTLLLKNNPQHFSKMALLFEPTQAEVEGRSSK